MKRIYPTKPNPTSLHKMRSRTIALISIIAFIFTQCGIGWAAPYKAQPVLRSQSQGINRSCEGGNLREKQAVVDSNADGNANVLALELGGATSIRISREDVERSVEKRQSLEKLDTSIRSILELTKSAEAEKLLRGVNLSQWRRDMELGRQRIVEEVAVQVNLRALQKKLTAFSDLIQSRRLRYLPSHPTYDPPLYKSLRPVTEGALQDIAELLRLVDVRASRATGDGAAAESAAAGIDVRDLLYGYKPDVTPPYDIRSRRRPRVKFTASDRKELRELQAFGGVVRSSSFPGEQQRYESYNNIVYLVDNGQYKKALDTIQLLKKDLRTGDGIEIDLLHLEIFCKLMLGQYEGLREDIKKDKAAVPVGRQPYHDCILYEVTLDCLEGDINSSVTKLQEVIKDTRNGEVKKYAEDILNKIRTVSSPITAEPSSAIEPAKIIQGVNWPILSPLEEPLEDLLVSGYPISDDSVTGTTTAHEINRNARQLLPEAEKPTVKTAKVPTKGEDELQGLRRERDMKENQYNRLSQILEDGADESFWHDTSREAVIVWHRELREDVKKLTEAINSIEEDKKDRQLPAESVAVGQAIIKCPDKVYATNIKNRLVEQFGFGSANIYIAESSDRVQSLLREVPQLAEKGTFIIDAVNRNVRVSGMREEELAIEKMLIDLQKGKEVVAESIKEDEPWWWGDGEFPRFGDADAAGAAMGLNVTPEVFASLIDHTNLNPAATKEEIQATAREALDGRYALVAIRPGQPSLWAAEILQGSRIKVGPAIGFRLLVSKYDGKNMSEEDALKRYDISLDEKIKEITDTIMALRAQYPNVGYEIDFVINVKRMHDGDDEYVKNEIHTLVNTVRQLQRQGEYITTKVIGENCFLTDEQKRKVYSWAREAGADFVKTSTGFGDSGATVEDIKLMRKIVGPNMGIKAAGGVRTLEDAASMIKAAELTNIAPNKFRIGMSVGPSIAAEYKAEYEKRAAPQLSLVAMENISKDLQHEIKNPVFFMQGELRLLEMPREREDYKTVIASLEQACSSINDKMRSIVTIVDLAKSEKGYNVSEFVGAIEDLKSALLSESIDNGLTFFEEQLSAFSGEEESSTKKHIENICSFINRVISCRQIVISVLKAIEDGVMPVVSITEPAPPATVGVRADGGTKAKMTGVTGQAIDIEQLYRAFLVTGEGRTPEKLSEAADNVHRNFGAVAAADEKLLNKIAAQLQTLADRNENPSVIIAAARALTAVSVASLSRNGYIPKGAFNNPNDVYILYTRTATRIDDPETRQALIKNLIEFGTAPAAKQIANIAASIPEYPEYPEFKATCINAIRTILENDTTNSVRNELVSYVKYLEEKAGPAAEKIIDIMNEALSETESTAAPAKSAATGAMGVDEAVQEVKELISPELSEVYFYFPMTNPLAMIKLPVEKLLTNEDLLKQTIADVASSNPNPQYKDKVFVYTDKGAIRVSYKPLNFTLFVVTDNIIKAQEEIKAIISQAAKDKVDITYKLVDGSITSMIDASESLNKAKDNYNDTATYIFNEALRANFFDSIPDVERYDLSDEAQKAALQNKIGEWA